MSVHPDPRAGVSLVLPVDVRTKQVLVCRRPAYRPSFSRISLIGDILGPEKDPLAAAMDSADLEAFPFGRKRLISVSISEFPIESRRADEVGARHRSAVRLPRCPESPERRSE
jgi:hypothetical protein